MGTQHQPLSQVPPSPFPPDLGVEQGPRFRTSEAIELRAEAPSGRRGAFWCRRFAAKPNGSLSFVSGCPSCLHPRKRPWLHHLWLLTRSLPLGTGWAGVGFRCIPQSGTE